MVVMATTATMLGDDNAGDGNNKSNGDLLGFPELLHAVAHAHEQPRDEAAVDQAFLILPRLEWINPPQVYLPKQ